MEDVRECVCLAGVEEREKIEEIVAGGRSRGNSERGHRGAGEWGCRKNTRTCRGRGPLTGQGSGGTCAAAAQSCLVRSWVETSGLESGHSHWSFSGLLFPFPLRFWMAQEQRLGCAELCCGVCCVVVASLASPNVNVNDRVDSPIELEDGANRTAPSLISILCRA